MSIKSSIIRIIGVEGLGVEVLYDDREVSAGVKFADYELIGIPVRLVVSAKTGDKIEYKERLGGEPKLILFEELLKSCT